MRRAVAFCHSRSRWWLERAEAVDHAESEEVRAGMRAYALSQADGEERRANQWAERWSPLQEKAREFMEKYPLYPEDGAGIAMHGGGENDNDGGDDEDDNDNDNHGGNRGRNGGRNNNAVENNGRNNNDRNDDEGPHDDNANRHDDNANRHDDNGDRRDDNGDRRDDHGNRHDDHRGDGDGSIYEDDAVHPHAHSPPLDSDLPIIELELVDEDDFPDDYDFHADEY